MYVIVSEISIPLTMDEGGNGYLAGQFLGISNQTPLIINVPLAQIRE